MKKAEIIDKPQDNGVLPCVKLRIKSTCNKCRASERHNECSLGYRCDSYTKPLTIQQLIDAPKYGA